VGVAGFGVAAELGTGLSFAGAGFGVAALCVTALTVRGVGVAGTGVAAEFVTGLSLIGVGFGVAALCVTALTVCGVGVAGFGVAAELVTALSGVGVGVGVGVKAGKGTAGPGVSVEMVAADPKARLAIRVAAITNEKNAKDAIRIGSPFEDDGLFLRVPVTLLPELPEGQTALGGTSYCPGPRGNNAVLGLVIQFRRRSCGTGALVRCLLPQEGKPCYTEGVFLRKRLPLFQPHKGA
jgi:hypothetical protein